MNAQIATSRYALFIAGIAAALATGARAQSSRYDFVNVADSSGPLGPVGFGTPTLNNTGTVAFRGQFDGPGPAGIFRWDGGRLAVVADTRNGFEQIDYAPPLLNDQGTLAFLAVGADYSGMILTADTSGALRPVVSGFVPIATPFEGQVTQRFPILGGFGIDSTGAVVVHRWVQEEGRGIKEIVRATANGFTTIARTGPGAFYDISNPAVDPSGVVAFNARLTSAGPYGIYVARRGEPALSLPLAETLSPLRDQHLAVNSDGVVATTSSVGIVTFRDGSVTLVADFADGFDQFEYPLVNSRGSVVFRARATGGTFGIFAGRDPIADRIIGVGDSLFGSTVNLVSLGDGALNDRGDVAFRYGLADGRYGVALARLVPEPSALALLAPLAGLAVRRRLSR